MHKNPPISSLIGLVVALTAAGCNSAGVDDGASAMAGATGSQAGSGGGSSVAGSGGRAGSGGSAGSGGAAGSGGLAGSGGGSGSGGGGAVDAAKARDGSTIADGRGMVSSSPDGRSASRDVGSVGDGGMLSACPANPTRNDPPLTPEAFCNTLFPPCMPHRQAPYRINCLDAYRNAQNKACQSYNLCFGVIGMKTLIPYCSRAQGLGPQGNCS